MPTFEDEEKERLIELVNRLENLSDELMAEIGPVMVARNAAVTMQDAALTITVLGLEGLHPQ